MKTLQILGACAVVLAIATACKREPEAAPDVAAATPATNPIDATSVVDPLLSVRRVSHLRVVDASVMPTLISGNTYAATLVIAERAADFILNAR